MCLLVHGKDMEPRVATKDIVCYKTLKPDLRSPYQHFQYTWGKRETTDIHAQQFSDNTLMLHDGFYSFTTLKEAREHTQMFMEGFNPKQMITVKCIIPKGATYYCNKGQKSNYFKIVYEHVSDSIIIKSRVK